MDPSSRSYQKPYFTKRSYKLIKKTLQVRGRGMLKDNGDIKPWDGKKTRKDISNLKTKNLELMETEKRRGSWVEFGVW